MEKVKKYKKLTFTILNEIYQDLLNNPNKTVKPHIIKDDTSGHFLLYLDGWKGARRMYGCFVHIQITEEGKIFLNLDNTDMEIGRKLLDNGVSKNDLVLAFISPSRRADTGYAVA